MNGKTTAMFQMWEGRRGGLRVVAVRMERKTEVARTWRMCSKHMGCGFHSIVYSSHVTRGSFGLAIRLFLLLKLSYGWGMLVDKVLASVHEAPDWS